MTLSREFTEHLPKLPKNRTNRAKKPQRFDDENWSKQRRKLVPRTKKRLFRNVSSGRQHAIMQSAAHMDGFIGTSPSSTSELNFKLEEVNKKLIDVSNEMNFWKGLVIKQTRDEIQKRTLKIVNRVPRRYIKSHAFTINGVDEKICRELLPTICIANRKQKYKSNTDGFTLGIVTAIRKSHDPSLCRKPNCLHFSEKAIIGPIEYNYHKRKQKLRLKFKHQHTTFTGRSQYI